MPKKTFTLNEALEGSEDTKRIFTLDEIATKNITPETFEVKQELGYFSSLRQSFLRGERSSSSDTKGYAALIGGGRKQYLEEVKPEKDALYKEMQEYRLDDDNWFDKVSMSISEMIPAMTKGTIAGVGTGVATGTAFAGVTAIAGQLGPQAATPEEIVTVPAAFVAGYGKGSLVGSMQYWYRQGAGSLYGELVEEGIDDGVAKPIAHVAGALYGAIEFSQVDKLIPGSKQIAKGVIVSSVKRTMANMAKRYGANWLSEVTEEGLQEFIMEVARGAAKEIEGKTNKGVAAIALKAMVMGWNASKESAIPMLFMLSPVGAVDIKKGITQSKMMQTEEGKAAVRMKADVLEALEKEEESKAIKEKFPEAFEGKEYKEEFADEHAGKIKSIKEVIKRQQEIKEKEKKLTALEEQAKGFKTAEEFVESQGEVVFRGTSKEKDGFSKTKGQAGEGIYFTNDKAEASKYGDNISDVVLDIKNPLIIERKDIPVGKDAFVSWERSVKENHDGIIITDMGKSSEFVVFDKSQIKTKQQLTDIWNKAQKPVEAKPKVARKESLITKAVGKIKKLQAKISEVDVKRKVNVEAQRKEVVDLLNRSKLIPTEKRRRMVENINRLKGISTVEGKQKLNALLDDVIKQIETTQKKREVTQFIQEKKFKKVENLRRAIKLPSIKNMSLEQLNEYEKLLGQYQEGDTFLTQRQLETVDNTDLKGMKTLREVKERLSEELGMTNGELGAIEVSSMDRLRQDTALAEQNPFYNLLVEEYHKETIKANIKFIELERQVNKLTVEARKSKQRSLVERAIPTDEIVFDWLSIDKAGKAKLEESMTPEEKKLALFMQEKFADALEYLIQNQTLKTGRENYITNIRRGFFEAFKEDGVVAAVKEMFDQQKLDEQVFNILDQQTEEILPLEKFFAFSIKRKGGMKPSKNVAKVAERYFKTLFKKQAIDSVIPKLMIYVDALTPLRETPKGLQFDTSLRKFVKEWLNVKKGRPSKFLIKPSSQADLAVKGLKAFISIWDLGWNIPVGIAATVGEGVATFTGLGSKTVVKGTARLVTKKGRRISRKYEGFVGKSVWDEIIEPSKNLADKTIETFFGLFKSSNTRMTKISLLGEMTKEEYESETISDKRLAELKIKMGRWRAIGGMKSIAESITEVGLLTQYKSWAIPIIRSVSSDFVNLGKKIKKGQALGSQELTELTRATAITLTALLLGGVLWEPDDNDRSFPAQLLRKVRREALTILGAIDPTMILGTPRLLAWLQDLAKSLKQLATLEEYVDTSKKGKLKGVESIKRLATPQAIKAVIPKEKKKSPKIGG